LAVLATPALVGLIERAAMQALDGLLGAGERTVGSMVDVVHEAPTPVGSDVTVTATVDSVGGAQLWFAVRADDVAGQVASGRHSRFVVNDERFRGRAAKRIEALGG
jgi:fluoroacetyl-CoA thioesterase